MEPITTGMQGAAVEDVQSRLLQLGYTIDAAEVTDKYFGATTEQALLPVMPSISPVGAPS